jgi:hypothetical protein
MVIMSIISEIITTYYSYVKNADILNKLGLPASGTVVWD